MAPIPLVLGDTPKWTAIDPSHKGGPKNGHLAELDPEFAKLKQACDDGFEGLWNATEWDSFRALWAGEPPLPEDCPKPGRDVDCSFDDVPVRDGAKVNIKVMKSVRNKGDGNVLVLRLHGGGWAIGGHATENIENHNAANLDGVVLVSVDYRL